jgi:putative ABC transport system permease protein
MPSPGTNEVLIGADLADRIGLAVGDKFTLLTTTMRRSTNAMTFNVAGICRFSVSGFDGTHIFIPLEKAQRLLQMEGLVTEILVRLDTSRQIPRYQEELGSLLSRMGRDDLSVSDWKSSNLLFTFFSMVDVMYAMIGLIFFILASTVLINTTMMVIYERMREIGTVAALGLTGKEIVRLFFYEAAMIAVIGSLAGVLAGILITLPLSRTGFDMSSAMEGVSLEMSYIVKPRLNAFSTVFVFIYSAAVASAASFIPSRRAAKIEPVEALRYTG